MLKKAVSIVLASLRGSTYRKGTPRLFARCGLADGLFEHPARVSLLEGEMVYRMTVEVGSWRSGAGLGWIWLLSMTAVALHVFFSSSTWRSTILTP